jgi:hypothetical protein
VVCPSLVARYAIKEEVDIARLQGSTGVRAEHVYLVDDF